MAFTETDVAKLEAALAAGVQRVRFADGREVTYQDLTQMMRARDAMRAEIQMETASPPARFRRVVHTRT